MAHFGTANAVTITTVSSTSYWEYGKVTFVDIKNGRLVITDAEETSIGTIYLSATNNAYDDIILAAMNNADVPDVIQREAIDAPTAGNKKLIATIQQVNSEGTEDTSKTEKIYLYAEDTAYEETKKYTDISELGQFVLEAASGTAASVGDSNASNYVGKEVVADKQASQQGAKTRAIQVDESTYELATKEDLFLFASLVNGGQSFAGKTVKLIADIDLNSEDWTPIGTSTTPFSGTFDGQDHIISNLKVTASGTAGSGLFGYTKGTKVGELRKTVLFENNTFKSSLIKESDYDCEICNLKIQNATTSLGDGDIRYVAACIGIAEKTYIKNIEILGNSTIYVYKYGAAVVALTKEAVVDSCTVASTVSIVGADTATKTDGGGHIGGIAANDNGVGIVIMNCINNASITAKYGYNGGILAYAGGNENGNCTIYNCVNNGSISVSGTAQFVAGIVGNGQGAPYILYCTNNGDISGTVTNGANTDNISGIASYVVGKIFSCINNGNINGSASYIGGLVGKTTSGTLEISYSSNTGNIINTKDGGATGDLIACSTHGTTISNQTFADVAALQAAINSVSGTLTLKNLTVTDKTGTLVLPSTINNLIADAQYFNGLDISNCSADYITITIPNFEYTLHGDASAKTLGLSGANNKTTFAADCKLNWLRNYGSNGSYVKVAGCVVDLIHGATEAN